MRTIFKFGGASIQTADRIRNVLNIVKTHLDQNPILVVSALGKTTNQLEQILNEWISSNEGWKISFANLKEEHTEIGKALGLDNFDLLENIFNDLATYLNESDPNTSYDQHYDHIVAYGELASTTLIYGFFKESGINANWIDARLIIQTDNHFRDVNIDWDATLAAAKKCFTENYIYITQGFIGSTINGETTTLGREGSDYTASILSYCLDASEMVIWKDVAGVMNADPKLIKDAKVLPAISYHEAIEMTYFGAKVIHPKTIKPLQNKNIPLQVKCFLDPSLKGTRISAETPAESYPPIIVWKENQVLLSIQDKDFSFIAEKHLTSIFDLFNKHRIHIHLMQNSAISFSVCVDASNRIGDLINDLKTQFNIVRNEDMRLLTIRHYNESAIAQHIGDNEILLEQRSRSTIQLVTRKK